MRVTDFDEGGCGKECAFVKVACTIETVGGVFSNACYRKKFSQLDTCDDRSGRGVACGILNLEVLQAESNHVGTQKSPSRQPDYSLSLIVIPTRVVIPHPHNNTHPLIPFG